MVFRAVAAANGCTATDSILVRSSLESGGENFYVPNAFSPNGDGVNDCFGVHYWGPADKFEMFIYNRWGQLIYHSTDVSGCWDGTIKGTKQSAGTYVYLITVSSACSHGTIQRQGTSSLSPLAALF
jgi:gliding motility-associated-like protein